MAAINGEHLRVAREQGGWTVNRFAEQAGISPTYLRDIESGRRTLKRRPDLRKQFATILHIPLSMIETAGEPEAVAS